MRSIAPDAKTGGITKELESVIYVVRGQARMRWGARLQFVAEAGPGDFIFVPLECVLVRSDNEALVVNITDVEPVENPEVVYWVDPIHRRP